MITIETKGQLGNQLFEYATCRSIAEKHGYNFHITFYPDYQQIRRFNISFGKKDGEIQHTLDSDYCIKYLHQHQILPIECHDIKNFTRLYGFFQQDVFFNFNYENIKKWFSVNKYINLSLFKELYNKYQEYCFMHIRGGDFKDIQCYKLPIEYYIKSMSEFTYKYPDMKFVIITDDVKYARDMFCDLDIISSNDYLIDFKLLQTAKYLISSNSTFSWWTAYLNSSAEEIIFPYGGLIYGVDSPNFSRFSYKNNLWKYIC